MKISCIDIGGTYIKSGVLEDGVLTGVEAVSYTHLDVYKRQVQCSAVQNDEHRRGILRRGKRNGKK